MQEGYIKRRSVEEPKHRVLQTRPYKEYNPAHTDNGYTMPGVCQSPNAERKAKKRGMK
jgi:hypothetical protein